MNPSRDNVVSLGTARRKRAEAERAKVEAAMGLETGDLDDDRIAEPDLDRAKRYIETAQHIYADTEIAVGCPGEEEDLPMVAELPDRSGAWVECMAWVPADRLERGGSR